MKKNIFQFFSTLFIVAWIITTGIMYLGCAINNQLVENTSQLAVIKSFKRVFSDNVPIISTNILYDFIPSFIIVTLAFIIAIIIYIYLVGVYQMLRNLDN